VKYSVWKIILSIIFAIAASLAWYRRNPWVQSEVFLLRDAAGHNVSIQDSKVATSDGRRLWPDDLDARPNTVRNAAGDTIATLPIVPFAWSARFIDDDRIIFLRFDENNVVEVVLLRRVFRENWWGQLYRVEVWVAILSGIALLVVVVRLRATGER